MINIIRACIDDDYVMTFLFDLLSIKSFIVRSSVACSYLQSRFSAWVGLLHIIMKSHNLRGFL